MCLCIDRHIVNVISVVGYVWELYGTPKFNRAMDRWTVLTTLWKNFGSNIAFVDFRVGMFVLCINSLSKPLLFSVIAFQHLN